MIAALACVGALCLAVCQWLIYAYAPVEATLGDIQKIFYMHMPCAWWGLISFFLVFVASAGFLWKKVQPLDDLAHAAAETGLLFCGVALLTGMIWGRLSWGVWWTWDPRLTTTLVMWFIYAGYLLLRHIELPWERRQKICAVVGVVAFLDVPLVFFSARLFRSIHPAVLGSGGGGMEPEMMLALLACLFSLGFFWIAFLSLRVKSLGLANKLRALKFSLES